MEIRVPEFGESILEGTINHWLKRQGDFVSSGEAVVEIETEKINVEVAAEQSGILQNIVKQAGENVRVGEVIAHLRQGSDSKAAADGKDKPAAGQPATVYSKAEQPLAVQPASVQSQPTAVQSPSPQSQQEASSLSPQVTLASPAARKMARERGIDLHDLKGMDPLGRMGKQDLQTLQKQQALHDMPAKQGMPEGQELPAKAEMRKPDQSGKQDQTENAEKQTERIRMSRRRQTIANHLLHAQQTTAMLTTFNEVDMTAILDLRKRRKEVFFQKHQVKLGFMSFFTKAAVGALKAFPLLNAEIDGEYIVLKKYYDLGIAVSTDEGLVVPVVHNADRLSFAEIERAIADLADKAHRQKLTLEQLRGGTFTITNGGVFGSLLSTPILNAPQVGILGMHKIQRRPVSLEGDRMENREMMYLALSYDHRIVDGSEAVRFLVKVKELLEDPETLLLEG